ncbi:hypothetical protein [Streptomyces cucumeris]|uniref:hypothetical protein n=1 Tax=Streptomyces cucumeris TaxID=2962890 RepID=UPI003D73CE40
MGNVFGGSDGRALDLSNGGTEVFVEVLTLAVSALAERPWHFRFAALLTLQDQNVMGRGAVGFDLADVDWGATPQQRARAREFVLRTVDLALTRHRWEELGYEPVSAEASLRRFRAMVASYAPAAGGPPADGGFPAAREAAVACCVRHRVLNALPLWDGCVFCNRPG